MGNYVTAPCQPLCAAAGTFVYDAGVFSLVSVPGSLSGFRPGGINNSGQIVGSAFNGTSFVAVLDSGGVFSVLPVPGSAGASAINNLGDIAGAYDGAYGCSTECGFVYSAGGVLSIFNASYDTGISGINDSGQLVGLFGGQAGLYSGGVVYPIQVPGAACTWATGINDHGEIVGYAYDSCGDPFHNVHSFVDIGGVYSTFDVTGATATYATGVNNYGDIVGWYSDANGVDHGFLDTPVPEPSSIVLLASATGLLAFVCLRRKRRAVNRF